MGLVGPEKIVNKYVPPPENFEEMKKHVSLDPPSGVWMVDRETGDVYPGVHFQHADVSVIDGPQGLIVLDRTGDTHMCSRYDFVWVPRRCDVPASTEVDAEIRHCLPEGVEPRPGASATKSDGKDPA